MFRTPHYEGWEEDIIWQLADLFESAIGAPKILDARRALARYPPVHVIYAEPRISQCRDLVDWNSVRPALMRLFENHGEVYLEFGGHDEFRNIWFHCLKNLNHGGRIERRLAAIFFVAGSSQVCLPFHNAEIKTDEAQAKKQIMKFRTDEGGMKR